MDKTIEDLELLSQWALRRLREINARIRDLKIRGNGITPDEMHDLKREIAVVHNILSRSMTGLD